jgi:hypothetical protein
MIVAAAMIPMLALVGGALDMGRSYLSQTRLQQACDAGVLAARKNLGSDIVPGGRLPDDAWKVGQRFFKLNFPPDAYGSTNQDFSLALASDYTVNGSATAIVPTTVMRLFGDMNVPITVKCSAQFNYANTDIMMVLDTTGSMTTRNSGDAKNRIDTLRDVVKNFHTTVETAKNPGVRVRYGFVPYSTNVNVGYLLKSGWMRDQWNYEGRVAVQTGSFLGFPIMGWRYQTTSVAVGGLKGGGDESLYRGGVINVPGMGGSAFAPSSVPATFDGCIEERKTEIIDDYEDIDFREVLDLNIDLVPKPNEPDTQWSPILPDIVWPRGNRNGEVISREQEPDHPSTPCPARARKLATMTAAEVATYVNSLSASGSTYHDIGMIWGGRLLSPSGIFAGENVDVNGRETKRHLIFLTDGQTEPSEAAYGTYGLERLSQRRWRPGGRFTLTQTVENRFAVACSQVRAKKITVWVIGFGTTVSQVMQNCAGTGRWFQAKNAPELSKAFATIAAAVGDLRIVD